MKKLILIILLLPLFATAQTNGTIQKTSSTGTVRGSFGSAGLDTLTRVTGELVNGYILKYRAATNKWYASPDPTATSVTSVSGTTNRITSSGGTTPVIDISASYTGQSSITTLGTVTTGVWNGTNIPVAFGGTNISSYVLGDLLYASGTTTLSRLLGNTSTSPRFLSQTGNGSISSAPIWSDLSISLVPNLQDSLNLKANIASPALTGTPSTTRLNINGYTGGLPPSSGSATRGGLRLVNAGIAMDYGTVSSGSAWIQVSDENNYASNFELKLNPNGGNVSVGNLAGTGTRMVVAGNTGVLSTQAIPGGGGGAVTGVAVATANGFAGTSDGNAVVPTLTLTTSINSPVLAGNGTAISAATTTGSGSTVVLATSPTLTTPNIGAATGSTLALSAVPVMGSNTKFFTMYDAVDAGKLKYAVVDSVKKYLGLNTYAPLASPALTGTPTAPTATAGTNTTQIATTAFVQSAASSGTYTPTVASVSNTSAFTVYNSHYMRVGNEVTVMVQVEANSTTTGAGSFSVSLPVASNMTAFTDLSGTGSTNGSFTIPPVITGDAVSDLAVVEFTKGSIGTNRFFLTFMYTVR